jgi:molecular chaperone DnaJ
MSQKKDFYEILGVSRSATETEIKKAFRRAAAKYHPDQATGDKAAAEAKFKEVSEAYEVLGDKKKRSAYDQFGHSGAGGQGFGGGGFDFSGGGGGFADIFEQFFAGGQHQSGRGGTARGPARGADIEVRIQLAFRDAIFGTTTELELTRALACRECSGSGAAKGSKITNCKTCHGTGEVTETRQTIFGSMRHTALCPECSGEGKTYEKKCGVCHGAGRARQTEKVKVKIPAGVDAGSVIRLAGQGEAGVRGGPAGDLFVHLAIQSDRQFTRSGAEIHSEQALHLVQAVLGDEITVETIHGPVQLRIPAGTQSGTSFRLAGYGAPVLNTTKRGDHIIRITAEIPKKLSSKEKQIYEELAKASNLKPHSKKGWFA